MKKSIAAIAFFAAMAALGAQESKDLYEYVSASTVYLRHEVLLDASFAEYPELLSRLETKSEYVKIVFATIF